MNQDENEIIKFKEVEELIKNLKSLEDYINSSEKIIREIAINGVKYYKERISDLSFNIGIYIDEEIESLIEHMVRKQMNKERNND